MKVLKERKYLLFALLALLVMFAGCKGESPTAPTGSGGGGTGGGIVPPTGASVVLTVSNATPLVSSTTTITATVTQNNSPVPNGTAVEFGATGGARFQDTGTNVTIRTTTNGVATAVLTSASAGASVVTAVVNNVSKSVTVTFQTTPVTPPPPDTAVAITSFAPASGRPEGGETVTITGKNFRTPVRVLFDFGGGVTKEALVTSVTATQVQVLTPQITLTSGQTLDATISLINEAGTPNEQKAAASGAFTYRLAQLTPKITTVSPDNGPISGGTRITIFGEGFEAPVQVSFGSGSAFTAMQVISVTFNQIVALTPTARDVNPDGSGPLTGPVDLRIININSGTNVIATGAFRYLSKNQITAVGPTEGPFTGGTRVTIDGVGFDDPVAVTIGGVAAQVVKVTGTQIIAVTSGVQPSGCADVVGVVTVTNVNNGDAATGPTFTYRIPKPLILSFGNPTPVGGSTTITILNAIGVARITLGNVALPITGTVVNADGTTTYTVTIPSTVVLQTQACTGVAGVLVPAPTTFDVTYTSAQTTCSDTLKSGAIITPAATPGITIIPTAGFTTFTATITAATVGPPAVPASVKNPLPQFVTLVSSGAAPLTVSAITQTGVGCASFAFGTPALPALLNQCDTAVITANYVGTTVPSSATCTLTIATDAGNRTLTLIGTSQ